MRNGRNRYYHGPLSDHFDGERFFLHDFRMVNRAREFLKWQMDGHRAAWPRRVTNRPQPAPPLVVGPNELQVTYIGHATALIQAAGVNILTDPFFSDRASPVPWTGPKRVRPPGIAIEALPRIDVVLISHNHYDHMDLPSLRRLHDLHRPRILTPLGNGAILARSRRRLAVEEGDWGDRFRLGNGLAVTLAPARHWSKRGPHDRDMALWCAFVIETPAGPVYFAGDTGYGTGAHFRAARHQFGPMGAALLPIGAYEPRWFMRPQHMDPDEAVRAHLDLEALTSIAIHHSTIQLTNEGIDEPATALARALEQHHVPPSSFRVLEPGAGLQLEALAREPRPVLRAAAE